MAYKSNRSGKRTKEAISPARASESKKQEVLNQFPLGAAAVS